MLSNSLRAIAPLKYSPRLASEAHSSHTAWAARQGSPLYWRKDV